MKYFTKAWYTLCQQCAYQYELIPTASAKRKSEDYFQKLYAKRLEEELQAEERFSQMSLEELFGEEDAAALEEIQIPPFDRAACEAEFRADWEARMAEYAAVLPQSILDQVADLRVLALGSATRAVKQSIARFCKQNEDKVEQANQDYCSLMERKPGRYPDRIMEYYGFCGCLVTGLEWQGTDLILRLDCTDTENPVKALTWRQAEILEEEPGVVGSIWNCEELYPTEQGFEFHALLEIQEGEPIYFTVRAADVVFELDASAQDGPEQE